MQRHYKLRPSRFFAFLLFTLCIVALLALWQLPVPTLLTLAASAGLLAWAGYRLLHGAYLRMADSCVAFRLEEGVGIVLVLRNGSHVYGRLLSDCLVTPYLVILNVALSERRSVRSLLLMPDAMGADSFRRLRVALRWGADQSEK